MPTVPAWTIHIRRRELPAGGPATYRGRSHRERSMTTTTATQSRRTTLLAGIGLALGAAGMRAFAQQPTDARTPESEKFWANMGVALNGKTVLVTGSTDGLGKEVARQLGALGAFVIVHGRNQERGEEVVQAIRAAGNG